MMDNPFEAAVLSAVAKTAGEAHRPYWLVDQSAMPRPPWLRNAVRGLNCRDVLSNAPVQEFDGATPVLVRCRDEAHCARLGATLHAQAQYANALSLLVSPLGEDELCAALHDRTKIELPQGLPAILRYFDTRSLPAWANLLTPAQYAAWMSPVAAWWYLDRDGVLQQLPAPATSEPPAATKPWLLTPDQEQALIDDGLADAVVDLLITQGHPSMLERLPPQQHALVAPLVDSARPYKLEDPPHVLAFVATALEQGHDFHLRQPWAERLRTHAAGQCAFDDIWV